jgi:dethiobiotin synthetase
MNSADAANPIWLAPPVAPLVAARLENRELEIGELEKWFRHHRSRRRSLLVEGVGGWLTPVTARLRAADLAALKLPVLLVVANRLGCLNHTLLTIESIRAHDQECHALILNSLPGVADVATETNRRPWRRSATSPSS